MSPDPVNARVSAVKLLGHGVASYGKALDAALASARADANAAQAEFQIAVATSQRKLADSQRRLEMARAELARCTEGCETLERAVAEAQVMTSMAKRDHEGNQQAQARCEQVVGDLLSSIRVAAASAEEKVPAASQHIREYAQTLSNYLRTGVS